MSAHVRLCTSGRSCKGKEERHPVAGDKGRGLAAVIGNYHLSPAPPGAATSAKLRGLTVPFQAPTNKCVLNQRNL